MKKFTILSTFLLFLMFCGNFVSSQNLMTNGDLEAWDDPTTPTAWDKAENVTQESTIVHGDTYSAKQTAGTKDLMQNVGGIVGGQNYTITYYFLDNDVDARSRIWSYWTIGGSTLPDNVAELRPGSYSSDNPDWQEYTVTLEAPATADGFRFEVRSYNTNAGGGVIYYDDFSVIPAGVVPATITKAFAISETAMDVLYNLDIAAVDPADYNLTGTAAITFSGASIDGGNAKLVHLTGASQNMVGDITVDNIADDENSTNFDLYAGIMPVAYVNPINPGGTMNDVNIATFTGIVSANDAYNNVWFSDGTGAYNGALIYSNSFDAEVAVGDDILFTASRTTYSSLSELVNPELISIISSGNAPYGPDDIDGSDINEDLAADTNPGEKWEGQLVTITNAIVESYTDYDYRCSWVNGATTYYFHVGDNVVYHFGDITMSVGTTYSITGVVDWNNSGPYYRINPRGTDDIVEVFTGTYTWNYAAPNPPFWSFAGNWSPSGVPTADDNVIIDDGAPYPACTGANFCNNLTMNPNVSLTINPVATLTVSGNMLMESDATGTAWMLNSGTLTVNGTSTVQQYVVGAEYPDGNDQWHLISQPTASINSTTVFTNCYLKEFNATTGQYANVGADQTLNTIMKGYSVMYAYNPGFPTSKTIEFTGAINNGPYSYNLINAGDGWNLAGNPYPSSIDWDNAGWTKTNLDAPVYVWKSSTGNYITWNGTTGLLTDGIIPPMQGFFVKANADDPVIGVANTVRTSNPQNFYKNTVPELLSLGVTGNANSYSDKVFINFNSNSTEGFDGEFDAHKLPGNETAPQFFSIIPGYDLTTNVLPKITENTEIDLGFTCGISGDFTITADGIGSFGSSVQLYLKDLIGGEIINLKETVVYDFTYSVEDDAERFKLFVSSPQGISNIGGLDVNIYSFNNTINVISSEIISGELIVYNIMGEKVLSQEVNAKESTIILNAASGTYLVKFVTDKGISTKKVYVN